MRQIANELKIY